MKESCQLSKEIIKFEDYEMLNAGSAWKYENIKEVNEEIHNNCPKERKEHEIFTMSDWEKQSEHYIATHTWDVGRGKFIYNVSLEKELNNIK